MLTRRNSLDFVNDRNERAVGHLEPHCAAQVSTGLVTPGCIVWLRGDAVSEGTIEVNELRVVRTANDSAVQTPLSSLRPGSTGWEINVEVVLIDDVIEKGGVRWQSVQLRDSPATIRAVMLGGVIESHGPLLALFRRYKIRDARVQPRRRPS